MKHATACLLSRLLLAGARLLAAPARRPRPAPTPRRRPSRSSWSPPETVKTPRVVTLSGSLIGAEEAQVAAGAAGKVVATYVERGSS